MVYLIHIFYRKKIEMGLFHLQSWKFTIKCEIVLNWQFSVIFVHFMEVLKLVWKFPADVLPLEKLIYTKIWGGNNSLTDQNIYQKMQKKCLNLTGFWSFLATFWNLWTTVQIFWTGVPSPHIYFLKKILVCHYLILSLAN